LRNARICLGDVGASQFADIKAIFCGALLFAQRFEILPLQFDDRAIAQDVHVSDDRIEQDILFRVAQRLTRSKHLRFGRARLVYGAKSGENVLGDRQPVAVWSGGSARCAARTPRTSPDPADIGVRRNLRAKSGKRLGNTFVDGTRGGTFSVQRRIVLISLRECAFQRLRARSRRSKNERTGDDRTRQDQTARMPNTH
jgi:hypothetical protein